MTVIVKELRDALVEAGASPEKADAAAEAVIDVSKLDELATKTDIAAMRSDIAQLKAEIHRMLWSQGVGIVGLTVTLIKLLPG